MTSLDRSLLDQPTYIEKLTDLVERAEKNAEYCAICGEPYGKHSAGLMGTPMAQCPIFFACRPAGTTFRKYGTCEGSIPEFNDPTGENSKPCGSNFGTYRSEHELVLCDGCAEAIR